LEVLNIHSTADFYGDWIYLFGEFVGAVAVKDLFFFGQNSGAAIGVVLDGGNRLVIEKNYENELQKLKKSINSITTPPRAINHPPLSLLTLLNNSDQQGLTLSMVPSIFIVLQLLYEKIGRNFVLSATNDIFLFVKSPTIVNNPNFTVNEVFTSSFTKFAKSLGNAGYVYANPYF